VLLAPGSVALLALVRLSLSSRKVGSDPAAAGHKIVAEDNVVLKLPHAGVVGVTVPSIADVKYVARSVVKDCALPPTVMDCTVGPVKDPALPPPVVVHVAVTDSRELPDATGPKLRQGPPVVETVVEDTATDANDALEAASGHQPMAATDDEVPVAATVEVHAVRDGAF